MISLGWCLKKNYYHKLILNLCQLFHWNSYHNNFEGNKLFIRKFLVEEISSIRIEGQGQCQGQGKIKGQGRGQGQGQVGD